MARMILIIVALVAAYFIVAYVGMTLLLALDIMARAFAWLGVTNPIIAWLLLGLVLGTLLGLVIGLRRAGMAIRRSVSISVLAAVGVLLAMVGSLYPVSPLRTASAQNPAPGAVTQHAVVLVDKLHMRATPSTVGTIVGVAVRGSAVAILARLGEWVQVRSVDSVHPVEGWVLHKYLGSPGAPPPALSPPAQQSSNPTPPSSHPPAAVHTVDDSVLADTLKPPSVPQVDSTATPSTRPCVDADGLPCSLVPKDQEISIERLIGAGFDALNNQQPAAARIAANRASDLLAPWIARAPKDPWIIQKQRNITSVLNSAKELCDRTTAAGTQLAGCK